MDDAAADKIAMAILDAMTPLDLLLEASRAVKRVEWDCDIIDGFVENWLKRAGDDGVPSDMQSGGLVDDEMLIRLSKAAPGQLARIGMARDRLACLAGAIRRVEKYGQGIEA